MANLGKLTGSPWHVGFLRMKENDSRRDKRRCLCYHPEGNYCSRYGQKCHGSAHCSQYHEKANIKDSAMNDHWEAVRASNSTATPARECSHFNLKTSSCSLRHAECIGKVFCNQYSYSHVIGVDMEPTEKKKRNHKSKNKKKTTTHTINTSSSLSQIHTSVSTATNESATSPAPLSVKKGTRVTSKVWGIGSVTKISKTELTVFFQIPQKTVRFIFPDCFVKGHLKIL